MKNSVVQYPAKKYCKQDRRNFEKIMFYFFRQILSIMSRLIFLEAISTASESLDDISFSPSGFLKSFLVTEILSMDSSIV